MVWVYKNYALEFTSSSTPLAHLCHSFQVSCDLKLDRVVLFTPQNLASESNITFERYHNLSFYEVAKYM